MAKIDWGRVIKAGFGGYETGRQWRKEAAEEKRKREAEEYLRGLISGGRYTPREFEYGGVDYELPEEEKPGEALMRNLVETGRYQPSKFEYGGVTYTSPEQERAMTPYQEFQVKNILTGLYAGKMRKAGKYLQKMGYPAEVSKATPMMSRIRQQLAETRATGVGYLPTSIAEPAWPRIKTKRAQVEKGLTVSEALRILTRANDPYTEQFLKEQYPDLISEAENVLRRGRQASPTAVGLLPAPTTATTQERVRVVSPDGQAGTIPREQLEEALERGYRLQ